MKTWPVHARRLALCVLVACSAGAAADQADNPAPAAVPALTEEQLHAVGIRVARPIAARAPQRLDALGLVLDPTILISDVGEVTVAAAAEQAAAAELARLRGLYDGGAASLKMLEAAQAEHAKSRQERTLASARADSHWGPVTAMPPTARRKVLESAAAGRSLLVRADLPGRHSVGALPAGAMLDVDGIQVPGRVLGVLRQSDDMQAAGLLIEVDDAPVGFGPGARVPVALLTTARAGLLLPRDAVLYEEGGAYVYKQLAAKTADRKTRYVSVKVTLLSASGEGWLVEGIDDGDDIVVQGAGVLWSLQGIGAHLVDGDD